MCRSDPPGEFIEKGAANMCLGNKVSAKKFPSKEFGNRCPRVSVQPPTCQQDSEMKPSLYYSLAWSRNSCETTSFN